MEVREIDGFLEQSQTGIRDLHQRTILAPTPREKERCRQSGCWPKAGRPQLRWRLWSGTLTPLAGGPPPLAREDLRHQCSSSPGVPPALGKEEKAELRAAGQELPAAVGIGLANWNWKVVGQFVCERFGIRLSRSSCLNYLHRLGFVLERPKKRLLKAEETNREAFVAEYAALRDEASLSGAKIFFADEAHFRADAELQGKWVLKGESPLVD